MLKERGPNGMSFRRRADVDEMTCKCNDGRMNFESRSYSGLKRSWSWWERYIDSIWISLHFQHVGNFVKNVQADFLSNNPP